MNGLVCRLWLLCCVPLVMLLQLGLTAYLPAQVRQSGDDSLEGTWTCVVTLKDGAAVENYIGVRAVIAGDKLTWFFPKDDGTYREQKSNFRVDTAQNPKHFDWWNIDKPESIDRRIYSVSDNTLRWGTNLDGRTRPVSFDAARWQFTMKRVVSAVPKEGNTSAVAANQETRSAGEQGRPPRPDEVIGWGRIIDPKGDCKFEKLEGVLSITVPGTYHDLHHGFDAPRVLQDVEGDFTIQLRARRFTRPAPKSAVNPANPVSYVSGGILVWQSDRAFIRFQRAANGDTKFVGTFANYLADGKHIANSRIELPDDDVYLRLQRTGDKFTLAQSLDGKNWSAVVPQGKDLPLAGKVQVGVFVINATNQQITHSFTELKLTRN